MDVICSEPSPSSPTETFFESHQATNAATPSEVSVGTIDNNNKTTSSKSAMDMFASPLSDSSGYESNLSMCSTGDHDDEHLSTFCHAHNISTVEYTTSDANANLLADERIVRNKLSIECHYIAHNVTQAVYRCDKYDVDEAARRILVEWLHEVCEECGCEEAVFPLTVNYVDRFLERRPTLRKYQLQLIGVVCLLIASKIRQCKTLSINELCYMTDHSVTPNEILTWEQLVLSSLQWNVCSVVPCDYVDHVLATLAPLLLRFKTCYEQQQQSGAKLKCELSQHRLHANNMRSTKAVSPKRSRLDHDDCISVASPKYYKISESWNCRATINAENNIDNGNGSCNEEHGDNDMIETIRRHAITFITLCAAELELVCVKPSVVAAACVAAAVHGMLSKMTDHCPDNDRVRTLQPCVVSCASSQRDNVHFHWTRLLLAQIQTMLGVEESIIEHYVNIIESLFLKQTSKLSPQSQPEVAPSKTTRTWEPRHQQPSAAPFTENRRSIPTPENLGPCYTSHSYPSGVCSKLLSSSSVFGQAAPYGSHHYTSTARIPALSHVTMSSSSPLSPSPSLFACKSQLSSTTTTTTPSPTSSNAVLASLNSLLVVSASRRRRRYEQDENRENIPVHIIYIDDANDAERSGAGEGEQRSWRLVESTNVERDIQPIMILEDDADSTRDASNVPLMFIETSATDADDRDEIDDFFF